MYVYIFFYLHVHYVHVLELVHTSIEPLSSPYSPFAPTQNPIIQNFNLFSTQIYKFSNFAPNSVIKEEELLRTPSMLAYLSFTSSFWKCNFLMKLHVRLLVCRFIGQWVDWMVGNPSNAPFRVSMF